MATLYSLYNEEVSVQYSTISVKQCNIDEYYPSQNFYCTRKLAILYSTRDNFHQHSCNNPILQGIKNIYYCLKDMHYDIFMIIISEPIEQKQLKISRDISTYFLSENIDYIPETTTYFIIMCRMSNLIHTFLVCEYIFPLPKYGVQSL